MQDLAKMQMQLIDARRRRNVAAEIAAAGGAVQIQVGGPVNAGLRTDRRASPGEESVREPFLSEVIVSQTSADTAAFEGAGGSEAKRDTCRMPGGSSLPKRGRLLEAA